jgi:hypothetical protein
MRRRDAQKFEHVSIIKKSLPTFARFRKLGREVEIDKIGG